MSPALAPSCEPTGGLGALSRHADAVTCDLQAQDSAWHKGFTRRSFLAGIGMAGVAALGEQLVTAKASYAAGPTNGNTVINVFLRGGADGLRMLVPASSELGVDYLRRVRPALVPRDSQMLPLGRTGWALNGNFRSLLPFWDSGELVVVPAASRRAVTRSHFDAQAYLDGGGVAGGHTGWMDRLVGGLGPGTTFRALAEGATTPGSFLGSERTLVLDSLLGFTLPGRPEDRDRTAAALRAMYRPADADVRTVALQTVDALGTAADIRAGAAARPGVRYPSGAFGAAMSDIATVLRAEVGLQVAAVDVGGWDTHTQEADGLDTQVASLSDTLAAFMADLGPRRRSRVTLVVTTEFGRRVAQNASLGTDHGHGSVMIVLGGGLRRSQVAGAWKPLTAAALEGGDVPGLNDPFAVYAEAVRSRLGATGADLFPGVAYRPLGLFRP